MIKKNIEYLKKCNLNTLTGNLTVHEIDGELVSYLNLLIDSQSGEILNLSSKVFCQKNATTLPVALKTKDFVESPFQLELTSLKNDLPNEVIKILEKTLETFNTSLSTP